MGLAGRLPDGINIRFVETETGLTHHVLEAGEPARPLLLLLHGFPELAFSWRQIMVPLAEAGYWVVAPDQRGYGRTTGWEGGYDTDLSAYSVLNLARDAMALVRALDREVVHTVIGHDFGSPVAAWASLVRADVFPRVACLSAPFAGPPGITQREDLVHADLAALDPPRKHYQWYYSTREAAGEMENASQGLHAFLRAYFHMKSADWAGNQPYRLSGWRAEELAKMPEYYVMRAGAGMAETVAPNMPSEAEISACAWMPDADMAVYAEEFGRTGLQAALNWYRCATSPMFRRDLSVFQGKKIQGPACFVAGRQDWGWAQAPGALEAMEVQVCTDWRGAHLIDGAGHWVQQEQPGETARILLDFLRSA